ncbi:MAG: carbamoyltransferase HypF [Chloroflexia bacterium]
MLVTSAGKGTIERWRIVVRGIVQGVGFRPFVYGHALRLGLAGSVLNDSAGVTIEVEGERDALEAFKRALSEDAPPMSRIDSITIERASPVGETAFVIAHSRAGVERNALISPDTATCDDCIAELFDPSDRRYLYPFINCTNCGPRFTIVHDVPYDRANTTMRAFPMCPDCQAEYDNPLNRRFHAQPNACPQCGPNVDFGFWILDFGLEDGPQSKIRVPSGRPKSKIEWAGEKLAGGAILAIKGLGGYHLACDALNVEAVGRLRRRKHREARPFALMVPDLQTARLLCEVSEAEAALLQSRKRPIVLLKQRPDCPIAPGIAPGYDTLGIMLPYTPLHHILLQAFSHQQRSTQPSVLSPQSSVLVMTSGNLSDEPIAYKDDDAGERLSSIAEGVLTHNREIHMRCDDSVVRIAAGGEQILRRSRGYAPEPVPLPFDSPMPLLACGGHLKNTFCLVKGKQAFVSHHIGDLENLETLTSFREGIEHYKRLFDVHPQAVAYDLHPEYLATKHALDLDIPNKIGVQHHHAHVASVIAEHHLQGQVIGVAADGTGYGLDGAVWGCEIMVADLWEFRRMSHLEYVPLPGGDQAVRQPWRMAAVYLARAYGGIRDQGPGISKGKDLIPDPRSLIPELDIPFTTGLDRARWRALSQMIERGINSPPTSSLGRLFDAVAALLGVRGEAMYEGQAAIELEMIAEPESHPYPFDITGDEPARLNVSPMIRAIVKDIQDGIPVSRIAGRFHRTVADMLAAACLRARDETGLTRAALSGGVFQNRLLLEQLVARLRELDFDVYLNRRVPPNDGGLSFGQAAVAAARLAAL